MTINDQLSYYCFNKNCEASVYFYDSVQIIDLPLTAQTLTAEHHCRHCHSKLVSVVDIELRQALAGNNLEPVLFG